MARAKNEDNSEAGKGAGATPAPNVDAHKPTSLSEKLNESEFQRGELTPQIRARLLYEYCVDSDKRVTESVHSLFIIAEHYAAPDPKELKQPEVINGIPPFFASLTSREKSDYCYNLVTETLSAEAMPVTVASLRATRRTDPEDHTSSHAGRFVKRVSIYVVASLAFMLALFIIDHWWWNLRTAPPANLVEVISGAQWVAFGCIGALVHLLNHALTTTRLKTFEMSEERKIVPRLLLGGMFGFVVPWLFKASGIIEGASLPGETVAAFFGGYSVRFSTGLLERLLAAVFPETKPKS